MSNDILPAALDYLARGWSVIPVRAREKRPLLAWQLYQQHHASEDDLRVWFARWPQANVGIVTGAVSGLVVVDIDRQHGGEESIALLEREHGAMPRTVEAISGGGGRHMYYAHPAGHVHNKVGLAPGVDLRGDGGMIVAPPSLHPSGGRYVWRNGQAPNELPLAPLPAWLLARITPRGTRVGHPLVYWRQLLADGVAEGSRNASIAGLAGHLLWHGIDADVATELLLSWNRERCRPPLADDEVVHTVDSIARLHRRTSGDDMGDADEPD